MLLLFIPINVQKLNVEVRNILLEIPGELYEGENSRKEVFGNIPQPFFLEKNSQIRF